MGRDGEGPFLDQDWPLRPGSPSSEWGPGIYLTEEERLVKIWFKRLTCKFMALK